MKREPITSAYWRRRASETRVLAGVLDAAQRAALLEVAVIYDKLAEEEARLAEKSMP